MLIVAPPDCFQDPPQVGPIAGEKGFLRNEEFSFWFDDSFVPLELPDALGIISGKAFIAGKPIEALQGLKSPQFIEQLREAVGFFTVLIISRSSFTVITSLYRHKDIFYWNHEGQWIVTDELAVLDATIGPRPLNIPYIRDFVLDDLASGPETIFEGVSQVELGTAVTFSTGRDVERVVVNLPSPPRHGLMDALIQNISLFGAGKDRVVVRFSGGLDSSMILAATKEALGSCETLHTIMPEEQQNSEVDIALEVADQLQCELNVLNCEYRLSAPRETFSGSKRVPSPFDVYPYSIDATDRSEAFLEGFTRETLGKTLFLSGQGGDNVFLQNPSPRIVRDALVEHGPIEFVREAVKFSRLKNISVLAVLQKAFAKEVINAEFEKNIISAPHTKPHLMLQGYHQKSAKYQHRRSILEALQQYETSMEFGVMSLHPLLFQNIIAFALTFEPRDLYDNRYDRIVQRQQLFDRYALDVSWRRTKKAATSAVFLFLMNNKECVRDALLGGVVAPALQIDEDWLQEEINYNGTVTITDNFGMIFNMLRLEIFCHQHAARIRPPV
jgi:asparagine synthetase B (glutamine-hydrolysing)